MPLVKVKASKNNSHKSEINTNETKEHKRDSWETRWGDNTISIDDERTVNLGLWTKYL